MEQLQEELVHYKSGYEEANNLCSQLMEMTESLEKQVESLKVQIDQVKKEEADKYNGEKVTLRKQFATQLSEIKEQYHQEQQQVINTIRSDNQRKMDQKDAEISQLQGQLARLFDHYSGPSEQSKDVVKENQSNETGINQGKNFFL